MTGNKFRTGSVDRKRRGFAYILAMLMLVVMASMGYAVTVAADLQARQAANAFDVFEAQASAESGLTYFVYVLRNFDLASNVSGQALLDSLASSLQSEMNGTANLNGSTVTYDGNSIVIPSVALGDDTSFIAIINMPDASTVSLTVTGSYTTGGGRTLTRSLSMDFDKGSKAGGLEYGIYSSGPIDIGMNCNYVGLNNIGEASMYTEAVTVGPAIEVDTGYISGDVDLQDASGSIAIGATIGGGVNYGVTGRVMPTIDPTVFTPFATNTFNSSSPTQNVTLTNVRIVPSTNPVFGNDVIINGVFYIEAPNYVYFNNNVVITGVIVSDDPGSGASPSTHGIYFKNNLTLNPVEDLPNTTDFAAIRTMTGSAILTPGFAIEFKNNFSSISGTIAAESLTAKNNVTATISGGLILGDGGLHLDNNAYITVDLGKYVGLPTGVTLPGPTILTANPDTYLEN